MASQAKYLRSQTDPAAVGSCAGSGACPCGSGKQTFARAEVDPPSTGLSLEWYDAHDGEVTAMHRSAQAQ